MQNRNKLPLPERHIFSINQHIVTCMHENKKIIELITTFNNTFAMPCLRANTDIHIC